MVTPTWRGRWELCLGPLPAPRPFPRLISRCLVSTATVAVGATAAESWGPPVKPHLGGPGDYVGDLIRVAQKHPQPPPARSPLSCKSSAWPRQPGRQRPERCAWSSCAPGRRDCASSLGGGADGVPVPQVPVTAPPASGEGQMGEPLAHTSPLPWGACGQVQGPTPAGQACPRPGPLGSCRPPARDTCALPSRKKHGLHGPSTPAGGQAGPAQSGWARATDGGPGCRLANLPGAATGHRCHWAGRPDPRDPCGSPG